ncbi:MAG TPA: molybdopterin-dependent oxidoreductase, partial [Gemmataceae bacterium]|nr:molybdopterin-dependent oxidoreductase [Gemmataceae bacterium]
VNNEPVDIGVEKLNLIQAALKGGVVIPSYCWHPELTVVASCRMCLVEVGDRKPDGSVAMQPKVVPGCQTPAKDGTVIVTNSEKVKHAQAGTLESLLLNHPLDCPVCDKAGECGLQDFSYRYGRSESRMLDEKNTPPNKPGISDKISLFTDRCIMCSRCVRFTREVSGTAELQIINRGNHAEIDIFPGEPLENKLAGNVVDLCPVGALCSKDFLYKQRVWFLKEKPGVCAGCSTGCSIHVDHNKDIVYRLRPRINEQAQGHFMCDEGRYGYHYVNSQDRLKQPASKTQGKLASSAYEAVLPEIRRELKEAASKDGSALAAVLSPFLTCEEAFLLASYIKKLAPAAQLALGPVPVVGADDTYPKDSRGRPVQPVRFTIRAEKCPNRKGVAAVLKHFQGSLLHFDAVVEAARQGKIKALYLAGGYPPVPEPWIKGDQAKALESIPLLIVQDMFASSASALAKYIVPASAFSEKEGTFVNHAGLAQTFPWAVRPPQNMKTDGQIFLELLERRGLVHAPSIRKEMAGTIPAFAAFGNDIGEDGVFLVALKGPVDA